MGGDGKLAGIIRPNSATCALDENNKTYINSLKEVSKIFFTFYDSFLAEYKIPHSQIKKYPNIIIVDQLLYVSIFSEDD